MTSNPIVQKLTFTGSANWKLLMKQCAGTVKKTSMELGGNAPFIVFNDAILMRQYKARWCPFVTRPDLLAQTLLVQDGVYEEFTQKLSVEVEKMRVGDGLKGETEQGPMIDISAVEKVEEHIQDAVSKGAKVISGGSRHDLGGTFFQPTVLAEVNIDMKVTKEETFGPVAPLYRFETEEQALEMANDTEFGLAAYVYSRDIAASGGLWRLEYGSGVNEGIISTELSLL